MSSGTVYAKRVSEVVWADKQTPQTNDATHRLCESDAGARLPIASMTEVEDEE